MMRLPPKKEGGKGLKPLHQTHSPLPCRPSTPLPSLVTLLGLLTRSVDKKKRRQAAVAKNVLSFHSSFQMLQNVRWIAAGIVRQRVEGGQ